MNFISEIPKEIQELINRGALFVCNDSAGKDSQAMKILLKNIIPKGQLIIIHANLPEVEWEENLEHIKKYSDGHNVLWLCVRLPLAQSFKFTTNVDGVNSTKPLL